VDVVVLQIALFAPKFRVVNKKILVYYVTRIRVGFHGQTGDDN